MVSEVVIITSVLLQFIAAILALRLIKTTQTRLAWTMIAVALVGMEIRRVISLMDMHSGTGHDPFENIGFELVGLFTSACLLAGIAAIKPIFLNIAAMQEKILKSEERYRSIVTRSMEGIFIFESDTARVIESNPAFLEMTGYSAEELKRMSAFDLIAHDSNEIYKNIEKIKRLGSLGVGERNYRRKNGDTFPVVASASRIDRRDGRPLICIVVRDLSEIKSENIKLESTISELENALNSVKTLKGFLPICANCKKIRRSSGSWVGIENYIKEHSSADFTHSICPDCISELYPGI